MEATFDDTYEHEEIDEDPIDDEDDEPGEYSGIVDWGTAGFWAAGFVLGVMGVRPIVAVLLMQGTKLGYQAVKHGAGSLMEPSEEPALNSALDAAAQATGAYMGRKIWEIFRLHPGLPTGPTGPTSPILVSPAGPAAEPLPVQAQSQPEVLFESVPG